MKRSRNDQIMSAVNHYLKRRHYVEGSGDGLKCERRYTRSAREYIAANSVLNSGSTSSAVSYSSLCSDPSKWESHFNRFRVFVHDAVEPYRSELLQLLYPLFIHFSLELLCAGHKQHAQAFVERHRVVFVEVEDAQPVIAALSTLSSPVDVLANKLTAEFREQKYGVSLTQEAFHYLTRYLKSEPNIIILQMINQQIELSVRDVEAVGDTASPSDERLPAGSAVDAVAAEVGPDIKPADISTSALQRIIEKIGEASPPLPSVCQYTVYNAYQGLSSVCVSQGEQMLCAGFEDSRLTVWSLVPEPLPFHVSRDILEKANVSNVSLAGDCAEDIEQRLSVTQGSSPATRECVTLRAHSGPIYGLSFLRDAAAFVLSASEDKTVRLWDIAKRKNVVCYRGHSYPVTAVDVSPIGSFFATCSLDETAKLWSTDRIYPLRTFLGHTRPVNCVCFHANGNYLATGSSDSTIRLWTVQNAQPVRLMHSHRGMIMSLAFSPNGKYLASAGEDSVVKIWDLTTGTVLRDLHGHTDFLYSLAFSPDSEILASGGLDGTIRLWEVNKAVDDASTQTGDVSTQSTSSAAAAGGGAASSSSSLLGSFSTDATAVLHLRYTTFNHLLSAGKQLVM